MSHKTASQTHQETPVPALLAGGLLQRKCDCGQHTIAGGECSACTKNRELPLQRSAINHSGSHTSSGVPPIVHEVLRSPGQPLDANTRAFFEPRFGQDFSRVRVHTDSQAAESARAVNALAYTVGRDVVFGGGQYLPATSNGKQLLAHELTHVVQQTGQLQRSSTMVEPKIKMGSEDDRLECEAHEVAKKVAEDERAPVLQRATVARLQRAPADAGVPDAGPKAIPKDKPKDKPLDPEKDKPAGSEKKDEKLQECIKKGGPDPGDCVPNAGLTWADFTGTPPSGNKYPAATSPPIKRVPVPTQECLRDVKGGATGATERFQAKFEPGNSFVIDIFKFASDINKNSCKGVVQACERAFEEYGKGGGMPTTPDPKCPAAATARGDKATKKSECLTVVGADCTSKMQANSGMLLKHEQQHFNISCVIAKKANAALAAGGNIDKIAQAVNKKWRPTQDLYDGESEHNCNAAKQASWEKDIAGGLKDITIP